MSNVFLPDMIKCIDREMHAMVDALYYQLSDANNQLSIIAVHTEMRMKFVCASVQIITGFILRTLYLELSRSMVSRTARFRNAANDSPCFSA